MKISLGTDHAGFLYKEKVKELLESLGHEVKDFGTWSEEPVDYPVFIRPAAQAVANGECDRGIVFGGSGNGEAMAANKVRGVRCALCWNEESARLSRQHNDANVLSLGERMIPEDLALEIVRIWLTTPFEGGRHARRIALLDVGSRPPLCRGAAITAPRPKPAIETDRDDENGANKCVALEKGAIDSGDVEFFGCAMFVKKRRRDEEKRAEINRTEFGE